MVFMRNDGGVKTDGLRLVARVFHSSDVLNPKTADCQLLRLLEQRMQRMMNIELCTIFKPLPRDVHFQDSAAFLSIMVIVRSNRPFVTDDCSLSKLSLKI